MAFYTLSKAQIKKLIKNHPALTTEVLRSEGNDGLPHVTVVTSIPEFVVIDVPHKAEDLVAVFETNSNYELTKWLGDIRFEDAWRL